MTDFYIKDEGYAAVKALTQGAKLFSNDIGLENVLLEVGTEYCGELVWTPKNNKGVYEFAINPVKVKEFIKMVDKYNLTVESEY